jgi:hypothetical protein
MLRGNLFLRGWRIGTDTWWTVDILAYAVAIAVTGFTPAIIHTTPAFLYMAAITFAAMLAARSLEQRDKWIAATIAVMLLALPSGQAKIPAEYYLLQGPMHVGTIAFAFAGWLSLSLFVASPNAPKTTRWPWLLVSIVIFALDAANDPLTLVLGLLPSVADIAIRSFQGQRIVRRDLPALGALVSGAGFVAGRLLVYAVHFAGGFSTVPLAPTIVAWSDIPHNIGLVLKGMLSLWGANVFGRQLYAVGTSARIIHLLVGVAIVAASVKAVRSRDDVGRLMAMVFFVDGLAYFAYTSNPHDATTARYLLPAWFSGAIVLARAVPEWGARFVLVERERAIRSVVLALCAGLVGGAYVAGYAAWMKEPIPVNAQAVLGEWLAEHHLYVGLGEYWDSNIITLETEDRVKVRPVTVAGNVLVPRPLQTKSTWYRGDSEHSRNCGAEGRTFLVTGLPGTPNAHSRAVRAAAVARFGQPARTYHVDGFTVYIWTRNIVSCL